MESPSVEEPASLTALEQHLAVASDPCPMCSYNLHRLKGSNCPECGFALVLRVAAMHPRMAAFYTGLIGLAAGFGFALLLLIYIKAMVLLDDSRIISSSIPNLLLVEVPVLGGAVVLWIKSSGRIRRMGGIARWLLVAAAWSLSFIAVLAFAVVAD